MDTGRMTIPFPAALPLAILRTQGPVDVAPNVWTPLSWAVALADSHVGLDPLAPSAWHVPQFGRYLVALAVEFGFLESFVLSFAVLLDGEQCVQADRFPRGYTPEQLDRRTPPPLLHDGVPFSGSVRAVEGQRMELALHHTAAGALRFTGVAGDLEATIQCIAVA